MLLWRRQAPNPFPTGQEEHTRATCHMWTPGGAGVKGKGRREALANSRVTGGQGDRAGLQPCVAWERRAEEA